MNTSITTRSFLAIAGVILMGIGGGLLFTPVAFQASAGIALGDNVNLLSETRAPGGFLLAAGIFISMGAVKASITQASIVLASSIYLSYGASRVFSMIMDGIPSHSLIAATGGEIIIGSLGLFLMVKLNRTQTIS